jgi:hypothetical protein
LKKNECASQLQEIIAPNPLVSQSIVNITEFLNYYRDSYYQTIDYQLSPFDLPEDLLGPERIFRASSALAYTAFTLGHVAHANILLDHAKQHVPQMLSICSLDVAIGFNMLAFCAMMQFDFTTSDNYLKLSKNIATTLWKVERRQGVAAMLNTTVYNRGAAQSLVLKASYYYNSLYFATSIKEVMKKMKRALRLTAKWQLPFEHEAVLLSSLLSFTTGEVLNLFQTLDKLEETANLLRDSWGEKANIFGHMARSFKYALQQNELAMHAECQALIVLYAEMKSHHCMTIITVVSIAHLWSALGLHNELQQLLHVAHSISLFYPGFQVAIDIINTIQPDTNAFVKILEGYRASLSLEQIITSSDYSSVTNCMLPSLSSDFVFDY